MVLKQAYEPCPEDWMNTENPRFTICEVLREIYQDTENEKVRLKTRIAMTMAKAMNNQLMKYNKAWNSDTWDGKTSDIKKEIGK